MAKVIITIEVDEQDEVTVQRRTVPADAVAPGYAAPMNQSASGIAAKRLAGSFVESLAANSVSQGAAVGAGPSPPTGTGRGGGPSPPTGTGRGGTLPSHGYRPGRGSIPSDGHWARRREQHLFHSAPVSDRVVLGCRRRQHRPATSIPPQL